MLKRNKLLLTASLIVVAIVTFSLYVFFTNNHDSKGAEDDTNIELNTDKNSVDFSQVANNNETSNPIELLKEDKIAIEIPTDQTIINIIDDENIVVVSNDRKQIEKYNLKTKNITKVIEVSSNDKYIKSATCNDKWYVWVEDEVLITNYEVKPFQWKMVAYNIETKEKFILDISNFNKNDYEVPLFITYTPYKLFLSDSNKIVYCKAIDLNGTVGSQVVVYDLDKKNQSIIDQSLDVWNEYITDCAIYNDTVLYCKFNELNDDFSFRKTQYKYSDLYQYKVEEEKTIQLTSKDFYCDPSIYENKIAIIRIPAGESKNSCYAEMGMFEATKKEYKSLVNRKSVYRISDNVSEDMYINSPKIRDNLLTWKDTANDVRFLYDYNQNKFIEMKKGKPGYNIFISDIFKYYLTFIEVDKSTGEAKSYYIKLDKN